MTKTQKKLVPKLRFPEFKNAPEWEEKKLGEFSTIIPGCVFPNKYQGKTHGDFPFYKVSDISNAVITNGSKLNCSINYVDESVRKELRAQIIQRGCTVFAKIGEGLRLNRRAFIEVSGLIDNNVVALKSINKVSQDYFLYIISQLIDLNNHCGGAVPSVSNSTLASIPIHVCKLQEQQKIADCLSSLDDLISAETRQLDALKKYKKGLMQNLFPRDGETTPRLRFPEFKNSGEWLVKVGKDVFKQISNKNHNSDLPVLAITQDHGAIPRHLIDYHVTVSEQSISGYKVVEKGDFIISLRSFQGGIELSNYHGICSPAYVILRLIDNQYEGYYRYYLKTERFIKHLTSDLEGLRDGKMISYKQFSAKSLLVPSYKEQVKIAEFISSIDLKIEIRRNTIANLTKHKIGLMKIIFPG